MPLGGGICTCDAREQTCTSAGGSAVVGLSVWLAISPMRRPREYSFGSHREADVCSHWEFIEFINLFYYLHLVYSCGALFLLHVGVRRSPWPVGSETGFAVVGNEAASNCYVVLVSAKVKRKWGMAAAIGSPSLDCACRLRLPTAAHPHLCSRRGFWRGLGSFGGPDAERGPPP